MGEDPGEAAAWYARAAAKGFGRAEYNLALLCLDGIGVPRSRTRAIRLFRAAARHGITAVSAHLARLGHAYTAASRPTEDVALREFQAVQKELLARGAGDAGRTAALCQRAAEAHTPFAAYDLTCCCENGLGTPVDKAEAYRWYTQAADETRHPGLGAMAQGSARNLRGASPDAQIESLVPRP